MALINSIAKKTRQKNIYLVTLNTGEIFEIYDEQMILNSIREGREIEICDMETISKKSQEKIATDYSLQILARGMKTKKELYDKLKQKQFDNETIEKAIQRMEDYGYLNDLSYAKSYLSYQKEYKGKKRIAFELAQKGIDSNTISNLCEEIEDQYEICKKIADKYLKNKVLNFKAKSKLYAHLVSKGFEFETINTILNEYSWQCQTE